MDSNKKLMMIAGIGAILVAGYFVEEESLDDGIPNGEPYGQTATYPASGSFSSRYSDSSTPRTPSLKDPFMQPAAAAPGCPPGMMPSQDGAGMGCVSNSGAQVGYGSAPAYRTGPGYGSDPGFRQDRAYRAGPDFRQGETLGQDPRYQERAAHETAPGYSRDRGFATPGYPQEPNYGTDAGYRSDQGNAAEPGAGEDLWLDDSAGAGNW